MQAISNGETVSEIQALVAKIQGLESSVATWNSWRLGAVAAAALVAAALAVTSFVAAKKSGALTTAQGALIRLKDAQLARALSDKDIEIARAQTEAGRAQESAARVNERTETLSRDAESLKQQNLATETKLEAERSTRLRLERALAPRQFFIRLNPDNFTGLKPFAGTDAIIKHASDVEARRAADQIAALLKIAGWNVTVTADPDMIGTFWDGVVVAPHLPIPKDPWDMTEMRRLERAAESVVEFLTAQEWAARTFPGSSRYQQTRSRSESG